MRKTIQSAFQEADLAYVNYRDLVIVDQSDLTTERRLLHNGKVYRVLRAEHMAKARYSPYRNHWVLEDGTKLVLYKMNDVMGENDSLHAHGEAA